MKKQITIAMVATMLTATAAHAEHKLLVTEVLDAKQVEAQATFEYLHKKGDFVSGAESGRVTGNTLESNYSLGVGLGHGLEMTAFIPYVISERQKVDPSEEMYEHRDGVGDFGIEAKYRLLGGEEKPFALVTGVDLKFDTAGRGNAGTGTTDVSPFVAASANLGHHTTPYAIYRATLRNHGEYDTHTASVGLEKEVNETVTIDAKADANFNTATGSRTANEDFVFELSSYLQVAHNFYLIPSAAYVLDTRNRDKIEETNYRSADGFRGGVSLYYLF